MQLVVRWTLVLLFCAVLAGSRTKADAGGSGVGAPDVPIEHISGNDNRMAAGTLDGGVLSLHLEARTGEWHPEADDEPGLVVRAFAVEGGPLQVPGPLIRVVEGTRIHVSLRNRLDVPLVLHGMYPRSASAGSGDPIVVPAGAVRDIDFLADTPGTYFYWAASDEQSVLARRVAADSQLSGALIVDARGASTADRVLVITSWNDTPTVDGQPVFVVRFLINGKTWPHTERLAYDIGDMVRFRVLNVGGAVHPMHLHGFYFKIDSRGNERTDTVFPAESSARFANTERLPPGQTFSLTWIPTRPGNWLFHCHDTVHTARRRLLDGRPVPAATADHHATNHALEMMAGPILGITIRNTHAVADASEPTVRRQLRLIARVDSGGTPAEPAYGFSLEENERTTPPEPPYLPGPTIVLKRGEPVTIRVENRLPEATSVHWHGIELDSYYDGVAGFAGSADRLAPAIPPGESFEVRFTPPRSGTFIYHSHVDEVRQQQAGLTGALVVVDSPAAYDPSHDIVMLVTAPRRIADDSRVLLNGSVNPATLDMRTGERYRFRFINMHTSRPSMRMRLLHDNQLVKWRALSKDGRDLPDDQAGVMPAEVQMGNGETYDFEVVPVTSGEDVFEIRSAGGDLLASRRVHVSALP